MKILLIEDDLLLGKAVYLALEQNGFEVCWVRMLKDALAQADTPGFSLFLLDLGLPDGTGLSFLTAVRDAGETAPVLVLTARDALEDKLTCLNSGADDYLVKPFAVPELIARVWALLRRSGGYATQIWKVGNLCLDPLNQIVTVDGETISLSPREFSILAELARNVGNVVRKSQIEAVLFGQNESPDSNALGVHVHNLRRKLGKPVVQTVRGIGYMLLCEPN